MPSTNLPTGVQPLTASPADQWLGTGPAFPIRPGRTGALAFASGQDLVRQSIETILDTEPGERVMLPTFGCGLRRFLMEPNTTATRAAMQEAIVDGLSRWEPRIQLVDVTVTPGDDPALVWIDITYVLLVTQTAGNLVYPFVLR